MSATILGFLALTKAESKDKRQIGTSIQHDSSPDSQVAETGFSGAVQAGSKYFQ